MRILIVEDERKLAALLRRGLEEHGYAVDEAYDGEQGFEFATSSGYDVLILDLMLPAMNGFELCRRLRALGNRAPVLLLTARDAIEDRVAGLDSGADDYLVKPFAFPELLARIRALLRRSGHSRDRVLRAGDLQLDPATREVRRGGQLVPLTSRECSVLEYLLRNPNRVLSRDQIAEHVWGFDFDATSNVIDVYVAILRRKLGDQGASQLLHTVRGIGYQLRLPTPASV
ncbi:MAG TPA: response regulator transcription factor [Chloroflexota bacterium]|jgi:DNA-binding response OmpR family regulator|nr:response regulator transcription factor [Chloroflexota bacterium]